MNRKHANRHSLFVIGLLAGALSASAAEGLLPGYLTDPGANWKEQKTDGYQTPAHLKYPYVATHYFAPTLNEGEKLTLGYYVTDFDHSATRFGDTSKRFDVCFRVTSDRGSTFTDFTVKNVPAGDGAFTFPALPVGEHIVGVRCVERGSNLSSHTVWSEFRVIRPGSLDIPASATRVMTAADLKAYGLRNDGDYERVVIVGEGDPKAFMTAAKKNFYTGNKDFRAHNRKLVDDYLAAHPHADAKGRPGYAVYTMGWKGVPTDRAYSSCRVVYDQGYDKAAVAAIAATNSVGLQKFLDDAKAAGFRKAKLLPGVYRVSHEYTLSVPDRFMLDLNGATLKLNGHVGCSSMMVKLAAVTDSHLVNGTLDGDYFEHDYDAKDSQGSEWVCGYSIRAASRYCSVENVTVRNITGYGGCNGAGSEGEGLLVRGKPFLTRGGWIGLVGKVKEGKKTVSEKLVPGGLDAKGEVDATDAFQWTTPYRDIGCFHGIGFLTVAKFLGYRGVATRGWNYVVAFYDAEKKFLSREVAFQYRDVLVPPDATYARFSFEVQGEKEAHDTGMSIYELKIPCNCVVAHCVYDRCRAVGHASSDMRNFLFLENEFMHSGESLATCAYDAEDGWDSMQDVLYLRNRFHDNYRSDFVTCAGHNLQLVGNTMRIHLHPRTFSPYVVSNDCGSASFTCGRRTRTGYARYFDNEFRSVSLGSNEYQGWDVVIEGLELGKGGVVSGGMNGRYRNCRFTDCEATPGNAEKCVFKGCTSGLGRWVKGRWADCTVEDCTIGRYASTNLYVNCAFPGTSFKSAVKSSERFVKCDLTGAKFAKGFEASFENCKGR